MINHFSSFQIAMGTPHLWPAPAIQAPVAAVVPNREAALTLPQPFAPRNIRVVWWKTVENWRFKKEGAPTKI